MEILLALVIVLLCLVFYEIRKVTGRLSVQLPQKYAPTKQDSLPRGDLYMLQDVGAIYYTDMLYPVYGREIILAMQNICRQSTHAAYDLSWEVNFANTEDKKAKNIAYLTEKVNSILARENVLLMMQTNLDVLNGKVSIVEARNQTEDTINVDGAIIPPLAATQIAIDVQEGITRDIEKYLDLDFLKDEEQKRFRKHNHE